MERIIIREEDNTSNVEQLSSYDVVYVPGFSDDLSDKNLFRTPTLVTSKYKFVSLYGGNCPTFDIPQDWPEATATTEGFPSYAIPNYSDLVVDNSPIVLDSFVDIDTGSDFASYFTRVNIVAGEAQTDFVPVDNLNYFIAERAVGSEGSYTVSYTDLPRDTNPETGEPYTYIEMYGTDGRYWKTYSDEEDEEGTVTKQGCVCVSSVDPYENRWYENIGTTDAPYYRVSGDRQISYVTPQDGGDRVMKAYYEASKSTPPMFDAGDRDPGYRYALYLLSLGIPVYYECMNCGSHWEEVEVLYSDFNTAMILYGDIPEGNTNDDETATKVISPYRQGWYYYDGPSNSYKKAGEDAPVYATADDVSRGGTTTWYKGADMSLESMYTGLKKRFMTDPTTPDYSFDSMGDYSIKYMTTGGYPVFEYGMATENASDTGDATSGLAFAMMDLCQKRGDAIALIDHTDNPDRTIYNEDELSVSSVARRDFMNIDDKVASHGAMFTPWYHCTHATIAGETTDANSSDLMPASLAYLSSLAIQLRNYNPWLAVSGVTRGKVPYFGGLHTNYTLTNNVADSYQYVPSGIATDEALVSINPITYIRQYGYCIWGNRTLRNNKLGTKATSFLNIRNLVSDIKKVLYETSQQLLFEQNTDILWINFKSKVTPLLDTMVSNYILSDYKLTKFNIDPDSGEPVPAYMVLANLKIMPINSVEVFDLTIQLENNEVEVSEEE